MYRKVLSADFFWPLAMLLVGSAGAFLILSYSLAAHFDTAVRDREIAIVENGVDAFASDLADRVLPLAIWDEAVEHLDGRVDAEWASEQLGQLLGKREGFEFVAVLDSSNTGPFLFERGEVADPKRFAIMAPQTAALVSKVRRQEIRRGSLDALLARQPVPSPIQETTLTIIEDRVYVLTATLVQPDFGRVKLSGATAPIVVTAIRFDGPLLKSFGDRFLLERLHVHPGDNRYEPGQAHAALTNTEGMVVATMDWFSQTPGTAILRQVLPAILILLSTFGFAALYLYRRSRNTAKGLIASEARAHRLAYSDILTGLPNAAALEEWLSVEIRALEANGGQMAVLCISVDRFREVNDTFGRSVGDDLIASVVRRLQRLDLAGNTLARLSVDEFVLLQPKATRQEAIGLANEIQDALSIPFELAIGATPSQSLIGICLVSTSMDPAEMLRQATLARGQAAPDQDRGVRIFEPEMDAALRTRLQLESGLRFAIARDELELAYQPQVDSQGQVVGVEALLRWRHPTLGNVSPAYFIPIAEACGMIGDIGRFTLRRAFEDSRRWPDLRVGVNVSPSQLEQGDFLEQVEWLIEECGVDPGQFELEITEGVLVKNSKDASGILDKLRSLGFKLALDDFGTGYSSLSYLSRYAVDKIKIDRSFVTQIGLDSESIKVISAVVKLARALRISVIAEGVETEEQWLRLLSIGCNQFQGFLFGSAVTAEQLGEVRARTRPTRLNDSDPVDITAAAAA
jgi:diguanylate cyclase (GGDEF)-like protein